MRISGLLSKFSYSAGRSVILLIRSLLLVYIITNFIGESAYGVWALMIGYIGIFKITGTLHLHGALIRFHDEDGDQIYSDIIIITILAISVSTILILSLDASLNVLSNIIVGIPKLLLISVFVSEALFLVLMNIPRAQGNIRKYEIIRSGRAFIEIILILVASKLAANLVPIVSIVLLTSAVSNLFILYDNYNLLEVPTNSLGIKYIKYGLPMLPKEVSSQLIKHADKFILLYFFSPTVVGIYTVCYNASTILSRPSEILSTTLYPEVTSAWDDADISSIEDLYNDILEKYTILGIPAIAGIGLISSPILDLVSTSLVAGRGSEILLVLSLGFGIYGFANITTYIINSNNRNDILAVISGFGSILNVAVNFILIPKFGIFGAAFATLISYMIMSGAIIFVVCDYIQLTIPLRQLIIACVSTLTMVAILWNIPKYGISVLTYPLIGSIVYFSMYRMIDRVWLQT